MATGKKNWTAWSFINKGHQTISQGTMAPNDPLMKHMIIFISGILVHIYSGKHWQNHTVCVHVCVCVCTCQSETKRGLGNHPGSQRLIETLSPDALFIKPSRPFKQDLFTVFTSCMTWSVGSETGLNCLPPNVIVPPQTFPAVLLIDRFTAERQMSRPVCRRRAVKHSELLERESQSEEKPRCRTPGSRQLFSSRGNVKNHTVKGLTQNVLMSKQRCVIAVTDTQC